MQNDKNKNSFCPAHWDDIQFSPSQGYLYGCCKATPLSSMEELQERKAQSLNGTRPQGCEYCWKTEDQGLDSLRHLKISKWDKTDRCRLLTLTLGNLCNFQCTYCNEKFSSRWETDKKRNGEIQLKFDRDVYYGGKTCSNAVSQTYIDFYNKMKPSEILTVSGGEPLMGNIFYDILSECDLSHLKEIRVSTNLNYPNTKILDKLLSLDSNKIVFNASIDTVNLEMQEYLRYGFSMQAFDLNLLYILENTQAIVRFNSLITANTVNGLYNLYEFVYNLKILYPNRIGWFPSHCVQPRIHGFEVLQDDERSTAIEEVKVVIGKVNDYREEVQLNGILAALENTKFDAALQKDQQSFFVQFSDRNNITTPLALLRY